MSQFKKTNTMQVLKKLLFIALLLSVNGLFA